MRVTLTPFLCSLYISDLVTSLYIMNISVPVGDETVCIFVTPLIIYNHYLVKLIYGVNLTVRQNWLFFVWCTISQ